MKRIVVKGIAAGMACFGLAWAAAWAQDAGRPPYLDPNLPAEQRAADLVNRMTLEEKASQLVNEARAIPRLHVPSYDWWSEALHGVAVDGTTEFPEPIGLGATFDPAAIHRMGVDISIEGRIKYAQAVQAHGHSNIFEGLDFWAPNLNIFRDPRWGRGQETYGEDPFLTGRMGVAFVTGMQGDDPRYYRVIATPKHFAVHSGPEATRHTADVKVSKHDEMDTYLPAFRAAVTEGKAGSIMCAYNSINGEPACANQFLLEDQLRGKWGFQGYVVSDCNAVLNIFNSHHYEPTLAQAFAISLRRGMDNECSDWPKVKDDHDYKPYLDAVKQGYLNESDIDKALRRLFTARFKLGLFDPPSMVPFSHIDPAELNSADHRALALRLANESMVLLKNDGTLPLKTTGIKIALIGPLARQTSFLLGNYTGLSNHMVSIDDAMREELANDTIIYAEGTQFLSQQADAVPASALKFEGKPGLQAIYTENEDGRFSERGARPPVLASRIESSVNATTLSLPDEVVGKGPIGIRWEGTLTAPATGDYNLGLEAKGHFRVLLNDKEVTQDSRLSQAGNELGHVHMEKGKAYPLVVEYEQTTAGQPIAARLVWRKVDYTPQPGAIEAAKNADVVVAVVGITSELENEGIDRTSIDLPKPEQDLLEALSATGKPLVVVLTNGSPLAVNWAAKHANAILEAWYPGEEGAMAVAQTLSGWNDPGGRLPVTFYKGVDQLPPFADYSMKNRTYRYFTGTPLYPFGYGLSYTTFAYSNLTLPAAPIHAGEPMVASVTVTNTGDRAGDEVVQLYLSFPNVLGAPLRALRAFERVELEAGASKQVSFYLNQRDLSMVNEAGEPIIAEGRYTVSVGGGQPNTGAPTVTGSFSVIGTVTLPE